MRRDEQLASCRILGAKEIFWGGYQDTEVPVTRQAIQQIEDVVKKIDPAFIFVNYFDDTHQDHRHLATCTVTATRYTHNVLFYETPTTQNFSPTVYVDIDGLLEDKVRSLEAHASQVQKTNVEGLSILEVARSSAHFRGIQGRVRAAEAFVSLRLFINVGADLV